MTTRDFGISVGDDTPRESRPFINDEDKGAYYDGKNMALFEVGSLHSSLHSLHGCRYPPARIPALIVSSVCIFIYTKFIF